MGPLGRQQAAVQSLQPPEDGDLHTCLACSGRRWQHAASDSVPGRSPEGVRLENSVPTPSMNALCCTCYLLLKAAGGAQATDGLHGYWHCPKVHIG